METAVSLSVQNEERKFGKFKIQSANRKHEKEQKTANNLLGEFE